MTRLRLFLPPGYAPVPGTGRAATTSAPVGREDPVGTDAVLGADRAARGVVTTGALALDGSTTAWLTVAVTALDRAPPGGGAIVAGIVEVLRTRYPAADVRPVTLPAGPAVLVRFLVGLAGVAAVLGGLHLAVDRGDDLPAAPTLAVGAVLGVAVVVLLMRDDPLQRPRRLLWADLAARFHGDRVRIVVGPLDRRHHQFVPQLAESLGYRPTWGGSRHVQAYRRVRPEGSPTPGPETPPRQRATSGWPRRERDLVGEGRFVP